MIIRIPQLKIDMDTDTAPLWRIQIYTGRIKHAIKDLEKKGLEAVSKLDGGNYQTFIMYQNKLQDIVDKLEKLIKV